MSDPAIYRFQDRSAVCRTRADTERTIRMVMDREAKTGWNMWAVERLQDGRLVGRAGIKHRDGGYRSFDAAKAARGGYEMEIGNDYAPDVWGQGLASEVARALVDWGFRVKKLARIVGVCDAENVASRRALEKAGLVYERAEIDSNGTILDYLAKNADPAFAGAP